MNPEPTQRSGSRGDVAAPFDPHTQAAARLLGIPYAEATRRLNAGDSALWEAARTIKFQEFAPPRGFSASELEDPAIEHVDEAAGPSKPRNRAERRAAKKTGKRRAAKKTGKRHHG